MTILYCCNGHAMSSSNTSKAGKCKECKRQYDAIRYKAKLEYFKERNAEWRRNPENAAKEKARLKQWRKDNIEKKRKQNAQWAKDNPDKVRASVIKHAERNPGIGKLYQAKWRALHPDKAKEKAIANHKKNPETRRANWFKRRALQLDAFVEKVAFAAVLQRDNGKCQLCGGKVHMNKKSPHPLSPSLDHILPLTKGGKHEQKNVQLAHLRCNISKGNRSLQEQLCLIG